MALHAAIKGKLLSVIGDEVSRFGDRLKRVSVNFHIVLIFPKQNFSGYLRWIPSRWNW